MAKKWEEARVAREAKLDGLQERLISAVDGLVTGEDWQRAMTFAARFRSRSFNNTLLIWSQHLDAFESGRVPVAEPSYVAGFRQWQTLGRQVDKGQSGYMIFAPVTARFASAKPGNAASWRRLQRGEKPRAGEVARSKIIGVKPAYVWDVSQTSGDPIPERPMPVLLEGKAPTRIEGEVGTFQELSGGNDTQIAATYSAENVGPVSLSPSAAQCEVPRTAPGAAGV
ncbi:ArdC family protein [Corynebacterium riegelii]|uniref:ArdC family protein n=1 Tax=Corynebacterium riegelii TaxID=156976 RepID=UPI0023F74666|nr:ArdC family protein [Corynebacterium riegelii]